jgi:mannose-1-phosphate guanylyltransferase
MFFWRISSFLAELSAASPQLARAVEPIAAALRDGDDKWVRSLFRDLPAVSIDYALMEKARRVLVVKSDFGWDDIGAWDALDRTMPLDGSGNVTVGDPVLVNCSGCIVVNEPGSAKQTVAVVGMDGFVVIVSGDAVLVVPKDRTQEVRAAVAELKRRGSDRL